MKTLALALAGTAAAVGTADAAVPATDPPSPHRTALRAPLSGHVTLAAHMRAARAAELRDELTDRAVRLARRAGGADLARTERFRLRGAAPADLRERIRALRARIRDARAAPATATEAPAAPPALEAIAACESGGNPATDTGNGFYGKYQFTLETWQAVGGTGNPAAASEAEQDRRAAILYARQGASPWPTCGR